MTHSTQVYERSMDPLPTESSQIWQTLLYLPSGAYLTKWASLKVEEFAPELLGSFVGFQTFVSK